MATPVIMPRQGQSVETCIITSWLKKKGEQVSTGDLLFSYETDKAAFDMESPADGMLLDVFFKEGDEVPVLTAVAVIGAAGEKTGEFYSSPEKKPVPASSANPAGINLPGKESLDVPAVHGDGKVKISPRARKLADAKGIDISLVAGTGPGGRIIFRDIEDSAAGNKLPAADHQPASSGFTDQPLSNVRLLISKAMHTSLRNSAQLTHHMSADARRILEARRAVKESGKSNITLNDIICWCVIRALENFPVVNSHFLDDRIRTFSDVHLGIAVDTPRGLMVPAIKNAGSLEIDKLSAALNEAATACRKGNVNPELLKSEAASFTVSNLGNYGVEMFTPVINLPQVAILGVCTITYRPADLGNNVFGFIPVIGLSLTYDHRAVDGGPATLFLREIKNRIESFELSK
ncbi:MAG TPA: dihydrolipoamide acetyltransferase family protein [Bacteroidales bacterium]|nr:dihydrolipoamide acetyltransferase family protein [Bacteroidales bacterium]